MSAYDGLTPELMLDAVDAQGYRCDGRLLALNSFENRVYQLWLEDGGVLVAKFYRPARWSDAAIREEHGYAGELAEREIPVVAPLERGGSTLFEHKGYRFALYPKRPGRTPELGDFETLTWLGRFVARIHAVGALRPFKHRPALDIASFGRAPLAYLLKHDCVPVDLRATFESVAKMRSRAWRAPTRERARCARFDCTGTATAATSCGPTTARTSSTSTTRAWVRRCRTSGCGSRASARTCSASLPR